MKTSESPQETSDVSIEKKATNATAPRGLRGRAASRRIRRATGGELATTNPPTMTSAICIVNGSRTQKPPPNSRTSFPGVSPSARPQAKTTSTPASAKTKASGKCRSQASEMAIPNLVSSPARATSARGLTPRPRARGAPP